MADTFQYTNSGLTLKFLYFDGSGNVWNTATVAYETWSNVNYSQYQIAATEQGTSALYVATTPPAVANAAYSFSVRQYVDGTIANDKIIGGSAGSGLTYTQFQAGVLAALTTYTVPTLAQLQSTLGDLIGAWPVTLTVLDGLGNPVGGVLFTIFNSAGAIQGGLRTNSSTGISTFSLDNGTYSVSVPQTAGTIFPVTTFTVGSGSVAVTVQGTTQSVPAPVGPNQTTGYLTTRDGQGNPVPNVMVTFQLVDPGSSTDVWNQSAFTATSNSIGLLTVTLVQNALYQARSGSGAYASFTTPKTTTYALPEILGQT